MAPQPGELGGQVLVAARDPRGERLAEVVRHLAGQVAKLGVEIRLSTEVSPAEVERLAPDFVVVATGGRPAPLPLPAEGGPAAVDAAAVLTGAARLGRRVCVVAGFDGHRAPATLAEMLAQAGHEVTLISERALIGESLDPGTNHLLLKRLFESGVAMHTFTGLAGLSAAGVALYNSLTREERILEGVDSVVVMERAAEDSLYLALEGTRPAVAAGDCIAPRRVLHAVLEGSRAGLIA